jgi:hypothetical protein
MKKTFLLFILTCLTLGNAYSEVAVAGSNSPVCKGDTLFLTETGDSAVTWIWEGPDAFSSTDQSPFIANADTNNAGMYYVTITDAKDSTAVDSVVVDLLFSATITSQPMGDTLCEGENITLSVGDTGAVTSYQWYKDGMSIGGSTNPELTIADLAPSDSGSYFVEVIGDCGNATSDTVIVSVKTSPVASASNNSPVCKGAELSLTGGPAAMISYAWNGPNGYMSNEQNPVVSTNATLAMAGEYTLVVTNDKGCTGMATTNVSVYDSANLMITNPPSGNYVNITDPAVTDGSTGGATTAGLDKNGFTTTTNMDWHGDADNVSSIVDGNTNTYFHMQPRSHKDSNYIIIDMQAVYDIISLKFTSGDSILQDSVCTIYFSDDETNWTFAGEFKTDIPNSTVSVDVNSSGQYILLKLLTTKDKDYWDLKEIDLLSAVKELSYWEDNMATTPLNNPDSISTSGTYYIKLGIDGCHDIKPVEVVTYPVDINNASEQQEVVLYPNPLSEGAIQLKLTGYPASQPVDISIINIMGEVVYKNQVYAGSDIQLLDRDDLSSGVYLIQISTEGSQENYKLIIE